MYGCLKLEFLYRTLLFASVSAHSTRAFVLCSIYTPSSLPLQVTRISVTPPLIQQHTFAFLIKILVISFKTITD